MTDRYHVQASACLLAQSFHECTTGRVGKVSLCSPVLYSSLLPMFCMQPHFLVSGFVALVRSARACLLEISVGPDPWVWLHGSTILFPSFLFVTMQELHSFEDALTSGSSRNNWWQGYFALTTDMLLTAMDCQTSFCQHCLVLPMPGLQCHQCC